MDHPKPLARDSGPKGVRPLDREVYLERRKEFGERYRESIGRYDQLVPWGAGGALLASITFLEKIAPHPQAFTRWMLLGSWGALVAALATSLLSHYTSSRIFSWRVNLLDHRQRVDDAPDKDEWELHWERLNRRVSRWGRLTAILNVVAGAALIGGVLLMAAFAFYNAPFAPEP